MKILASRKTGAGWHNKPKALLSLGRTVLKLFHPADFVMARTAE
jgi:hypothetical protein